MYTGPSHPNESLSKSLWNVVFASPDISSRYWKYVMRFWHSYYSWINCARMKFHSNSLLLIDRRLGNQKVKLVRTVFKVRTTRLWSKANESILQIVVNVSAWPLKYLFWVLLPPKWRSKRKQNSMNFPCNISNFVGFSFLSPLQSFLWEGKHRTS